MMAPFITASMIDLFRECRVFPSLPWAADDSAVAQAGTDAHEQALRPGGLEPPFLAWFGDEPRYEVSIGWEGQRALILGENIKRAYDLPESDPGPLWLGAARNLRKIEARARTLAESGYLTQEEVLALGVVVSEIDAGMCPIDSPLWLAGTADAVSVRGGVLSVADLKTGRKQVSGGLPPPDKSGQLRLLAAMMWRAMRERSQDPNWAPARVRLAWFLHAEGDEPRVEDAELDPAELWRWSESLMANALAARNNPPPARPGAHCRYCPAFDSCPSQEGAIRRLAEMTGSFISDEDVITAHLTVQHAEKQIERTKLAIRNYLSRRQDQVRAGNARDVEVNADKVLRLASSTRRSINGPLALASGIIPPEAADVSVTLESLRAWLAEYPRRLSELRGLTDRETDRSATADDVMALLEAVGAVTQSRTIAFPQIVKKKENTR